MGDIGLSDGGGNYRLLEQTTEDQSATARGAAIKPERKLQVGLQMLRGDRALVGAEDPALEKAGDTMHTGHGDVSGIAGVRKHGLTMHVALLGQLVVGAPAIGAHESTRRYHIAHKGLQAGG